MKRIAVFGGTFNPVHNGHIQMATAVSLLDFIDKLLIIPDNIPPHKQPEFLACDEHRIKMCEIAFGSMNKILIDTREIARGGKSFTFDTLTELKEEYTDCEFYLVCGGDMVMSLDTWYNFSGLCSLSRFLVFSRQGIDNIAFTKKISYLSSLGADIKLVNESIIDVSSTKLREEISKGEVPSKYLPKPIYEYIVSNKVYG